MKDNLLKSNIIVEVSKDQMFANLMINSPKIDSTITYNAILECLKDKGVSYGINNDRILKLIEKGPYLEKIRVAEGKYSISGTDGKIRFYFQTEKSIKPKIDDAGRADFFNLNVVTNVKKDQLLAEIIPPTPGKPGKTVTGKTIKPKEGEFPRLRAGRNVYMSEDKCKFYSSVDGQPILQNGRLSVVSNLEIKGDVGPKTGNIDFIGSITVYGNVNSGYKIKATGNIEVFGVVEAAEIQSEGNIVLHRGIQGRDKGYLKAGQNVIAKYIENTQVEAGEDVLVAEAIMHSSVYAAKRITVDGKKGLIVGGIYKAGEEILAKTIDNVFY